VPLLHWATLGKTKSGHGLRRTTTRSSSSCNTSTKTRLSRFHIWVRSHHGCGIICKAKGAEVAMAQVSIGQVENLEDLVRGLQSVREALETACCEQIAVAQQKCAEAREEAQNSVSMLESSTQQELAAQQKVGGAEQTLDSAQGSLASAQSSLSSCLAQPPDDEGRSPDCSGEYSAVSEAEASVEQAQGMLEQAKAELEVATGNRISMEQRLDLAKQAQAMAEYALEQAQQECATRLATVDQAIAIGTARLIFRATSTGCLSCDKPVRCCNSMLG
jgi:chromosome segregation ATPase